MAKLNNEIKAIFKEQLAFIATADKQGNPNVGPKGSMEVVDDATLAYAEGTAEKTLRNLRENPNVALVAVDRERHNGFQIKGTAKLLDSGGLFEQIARRSEERGRPRPKYVVEIAVDEIYSVKPGMTAVKIE